MESPLVVYMVGGITVVNADGSQETVHGALLKGDVEHPEAIRGAGALLYRDVDLMPAGAREGIACPQCMQPNCSDPTHPGPEEVIPVAWCRDCGEVDKCDEDRCCLSCGTDLIVFADRYSFELMLEALGVVPEPAGAGTEGHES